TVFNLQDLAMVSPTEGWAVGDGGILHYACGQWINVSETLPPRPATLPTSEAYYPGLRGVFMLSATNGWAVGDGGAIWHYDGTSWRPTASPNVTSYPFRGAGIALYSVWMVSPVEGWAVGGTMYSTGKNPAIIERYVRGNWTVADILDPTTPSLPALRSLIMVSPTEGWAADAGLNRHVFQVKGVAMRHQVTSTRRPRMCCTTSTGNGRRSLCRMCGPSTVWRWMRPAMAGRRRMAGCRTPTSPGLRAARAHPV
ncbi:MAG: hypothetical protein ACREJM_00285, partial [Candidatus Saccharimonadales bacterium]